MHTTLLLLLLSLQSHHSQVLAVRPPLIVAHSLLHAVLRVLNVLTQHFSLRFNGIHVIALT